jgi:sulfite exporter TauE/SafE/plastocyanin domain-containing protein/copper chaperone CopZ
MTCHACERRIERSLLALDGVETAKASQVRGRVTIGHDEGRAGAESLRAAIEKSGYTVRDKPGRSTSIALGIGILLAAAYLIASSAGLFNNFPVVDSSLGYGMLLVIGLLTSVHCVAMCGGLVLSQSVRVGEAARVEGSPLGTKTKGASFARLLPGLLYNVGRVVSYTIVGAIVGGLGAAIGFSDTAKGAITALAGLFMLWLGLKMMGLVPELPRFSKFLPRPLRAVTGKLGSLFAGRGPFAVGLLGGLMPCGPLQTMQLYALGTGSAAAGALSMFLFSIGTVPLMLLFGATAALLPRKFMPIMIRASAVLVLLLGTLTLGRAGALAGIALPDFLARGGPNSAYAAGQNPADLAAALAIPAGGDSSGPARSGPGDEADYTGTGSGGELAPGASLPPATAVVRDGAQTVVTTFGPNYYAPFVVQAGIPVKWIVRISKDDLNGCNRTLIVPSLGIRRTLKPGDNLIEFTPSASGLVPYSCWMGMIRSSISVVPDLGSAGSVARGAGAPSGGPGAAVLPPGAGAGGCCGGSSNPAFAGGRVPVDKIGVPVVAKGIEEITIIVNDQGYSPAAIVLQRGMKAVIHFKPEALSSCNATVYFPEYNGSLDLGKGELATPEIPVTQDFSFQCGMGMLHGFVKTVDDLSKVNLAEVRKEIAAYRAPAASASGGSCCGN